MSDFERAATVGVAAFDSPTGSWTRTLWPMKTAEFIQRIEQGESFDHCPTAVRALAEVKRGNWENAHRICQEEEEGEGGGEAWVHAHLHRIEGDLANAAYWYQRAGRPISHLPLDEEWSELASDLLKKGTEGERHAG